MVKPESLSAEQWDTVLEMTHKSFAEHAEAGLTMLSCSCSMDLLKKRVTGKQLIIAEIAAKIVGYYCVEVSSTGGQNVLHCVTLAVHPEFKRRGIGKTLHRLALEYGLQRGCAYALLDTSCRAAGTRAAHRAAGYRDWFYTHFPNANYYSIVMRKDMAEKLSPIARMRSLISSWFKLHLKMNQKGELRWAYRAARCVGKLLFRQKSNMPLTNIKDMQRLSLRETQEINYELLKVFADFCEKHGLRYLLCYGTLIGAVRHKGYIPWDDDVDVTMPMPDYYKFRELFEKENKDSRYELLYGMKRNVGNPYMMLGDMRTLALMPGRDCAHSRPVAIDILPCYALSDDDTEARAQIEMIADISNRRCRYLNLFSFPLMKRLAYRFVINGNKKLAGMLSQIEEITNRYPWGSTERVRTMAFVNTAFSWLTPNDFDDYLMQPFEEAQFRIPHSYHEHLTDLYGSYMELPPVESRRGNYSESYKIKW